MCHHHLTLEEREMIMKYQTMGFSLSKIAETVGRNKSTISRELRRNSTDEIYMPSIAHDLYLGRRKACRPNRKLDDPVLVKALNIFEKCEALYPE